MCIFTRNAFFKNTVCSLIFFLLIQSPAYSLISHPLLHPWFYLLTNLAHNLIFRHNQLKNDSRAGLHLKAIQFAQLQLFPLVEMFKLFHLKNTGVCTERRSNSRTFTCFTQRDICRIFTIMKTKADAATLLGLMVLILHILL